MTAEHAAYGQDGSFDAAMFAQGFKDVGAARWMIPTAVADPWREHEAVEPDRQGQHKGEGGHDSFPIALAKSARIASNSRVAVASFLPIST